MAYNGQFSPLISPRVSGGGVAPINSLTSLGVVHEFKDILENTTPEEHHAKPQKKLDIYKIADKKFEQQRKRLHAKDVMSSPVKLILQNAPAVEAKELMAKYGFRHLPVVNAENIIVGMISDRELIGETENKTCAEIMTQNVIVCEEHASINEIAITLLKERINALPILNHKHEMVGIITHSDILKFVIETTAFLGRG